MIGDRVEPDGAFLPHQRPQHTLPRGERPDPCRLLDGETVMEEFGEHAMLADDAKSGVSSSGRRFRFGHQTPEHLL